MSPEKINTAKQRQVRTILVWLVLGCLLPGFIGAAFFFAYEYREGQEQLEGDTLRTARALGQAVDNHLQQGVAIAQVLAESDALAQHDLATFQQIAKKALASTRIGVNAVLRDRNGQQVLNTLVEFGERLPPDAQNERARDVFTTGKPIISDIFIGPVLKRPLVSIDVPVRIGGEVAYALSVRILPEDFDAILKAQGLPPDWLVVITDASGAIVGRSPASAQYVGKKASPDLIKALRTTSEGSIEATTVDGIPVISFYSRSAATNWTVAIGISQLELESVLVQRLAILATGVGAVFAVGLLLAWIMGGRIARSIKALIAPAAALGEGGWVPRPEVEIKEAAELAAAIERAAQLLKERAEALRAREAELADAHRLARIGTWFWDLRSGEVQTSDSIREVFGRDVPSPFSEMRGTLLSVETWEKLDAAAKEARLSGRGYDLEIMVNQDGGNPIWINTKCEAVRSESHEVIALRGTIQDITERKLSEQRIRDAALHDPLTELPNRAFVFEYCSHLLAAARRGHGHGALLFIDLDRFKQVNDLYGHETGDSLLREVGQRLVECTRREDLVGRLGGDEFVIVLPYLAADPHRASVVAEYVVESISRPLRIDSREISISTSIGISFFPDHATEVGNLIHAADLAMYQAKQAGGANYQIYTPELDRRASRALSVEVRLKNALKRGHLKLNYMPVIDIKSGRVLGAEALARLEDGDGEALGPDTFIPIAEASGLILELGEWVAVEACRQQKRWANQGMPINIAINVSPQQFRQRAFGEKLSSIIAESGIDPARLELEVTETTVMASVEEAIEILNRIKALGVKVALDDFGTGYSSLSILSNLPLDKLKIDQSFVRRIERDQASRMVTEAIIALGNSLQLNIVAEGIESEQALQYLQAKGCDQAQGYWISRPLEPAEFAQWYRERRGNERIGLA